MFCEQWWIHIRYKKGGQNNNAVQKPAKLEQVISLLFPEYQDRNNEWVIGDCREKSAVFAEVEFVSITPPEQFLAVTVKPPA